jgi:multidrug resistance efflux pump
MVLLSPRFWIVSFLVLIATLVLYYALANRYSPFTNDAYVQAFVVQVAPRVEGQVVRINVRENQYVEKGALLFEIDPRPFEHRVQQFEAALAKAVQLIAQMESELKAARADEARIAADEAYALAVHEQEAAIFKKESTTERKYLDAVQKHKAALAAVERARAVVRKKEQALDAMLGDEHAEVAEVKSKLATARLDLEWTRVFAPSNCYVTNVQLQEGSYVSVGRPVMTCIDADHWWIVANFRENNLEQVQANQPVEIAFKTYPGRIFHGTVQSVGWGVGQGQGVPSGELPDVKPLQAWIPLPQRFQVRIAFDRPADHELRVGATASVTIYTKADFALNPIAELWQRVVAIIYHLR